MRKSSRKRNGARKDRTPAPASRAPAVHPQPGFPLSSDVLKSLIDGLDAGVALAALDGTILYANPRFGEMIDGAGQQLIGKNLRDCVAQDSTPQLSSALAQVVRAPASGEIRVKLNEREEVIRLMFRYLDFARLVAITGMRVTELVETAKALETSQASVHSLSARILRVQDEERRRMARDLHDNTGQELAVLSMTLDRAAQPGADVQEAIRTARDLARHIESEVRTISYLLHPPLLDEVGLAAALGWFADGLEKRAGLKVNLEIPPDFPRLSSIEETTIFRIIQEALSNVVRHSGSETARVALSIQDQRIHLLVQDFGKGMPPEKLSAARSGCSGIGVGIGGMRERVTQLGGTMEIESDSEGTRVTAMLPIKEPLERPEESAAREQPIAPPEQVAAPPRPASAKKRVLIVDDHEITRQGIKTLLAKEIDLEICGEAADGFEALAQADRLHPDIVILDLALPRQGGLATLHRLRQMGNPAKVIVLSTHSFPHLLQILYNGGAQGYVEKSHGANDLVQAIRQVLAGKAFYHRSSGKARSA